MNTRSASATAPSLRTVGACLAAITSFALSCLVLVDAFHFWRITDVEFVAQLRGQSHMDLLGFGFWPAWTAAAVLQATLFSSLWAVMRPARSPRTVATLLLSVFIAASLFAYQQVARIEHLVEVGAAAR